MSCNEYPIGDDSDIEDLGNVGYAEFKKKMFYKYLEKKYGRVKLTEKAFDEEVAHFRQKDLRNEYREFSLKMSTPPDRRKRMR